MVTPNPTTKVLLAVACICLIIIYYYGSSKSIASADVANLLARTHDSVVENAENRRYVNLILFLQASLGLVFIFVPIVVVVRKNQRAFQRLHQRKQLFRDRQPSRGIDVGLSEAVDSEKKQLEHLLHVHPDLTPYDLKLCSLLQRNLSSKEIAETMNITPGSVNTARYRLRKKLALRKEADLVIYLSKLAQHT